MTTETIPLTQDQGGARPNGPGANRFAIGADTVSAHSGDAPSRDALTYALALIAEECAEATQLIGKALRFGYDTPGAPESPFNGVSARTNLPKELGDIRAAIRFAIAHGFVDPDEVAIYEDRKLAKLLNPNSRDNLGRQLAPTPSDSDSRRMAETGTGSVRSTASAGRTASPETHVATSLKGERA